MTESMIQRLQQWYHNECDGDWEHAYGIKIETLDNPGWIVKIDLTDTSWEAMHIPYTLNEISETEWLGFKFENQKFEGAGSPDRLEEIIGVFFEQMEEWDENKIPNQ